LSGLECRNPLGGTDGSLLVCGGGRLLDLCRDACAFRHINLHWIDELTVDHHLIVEMRAGGEARAAKKPNHLSLVHFSSRRDVAADAGHMGVGRDNTVGVLDLDAQAVSYRPFRLDHRTIARRQDGRADPGYPIHTRVHPEGAKNGMPPHAEARLQMPVGDRLSKHELLA
jgi:hypothetical protein